VYAHSLLLLFFCRLRLHLNEQWHWMPSYCLHVCLVALKRKRKDLSVSICVRVIYVRLSKFRTMKTEWRHSCFFSFFLFLYSWLLFSLSLSLFFSTSLCWLLSSITKFLRQYWKTKQENDT
jgi:hypothetical protein